MLLFLICGLFSSGLQAKAPSRVISLNLCTDQLLMMLAEPEQVAGITSLARDCSVSVLCQEAKRFPVIHSGTETLLTQRADLVLGGDYTTTTASFATQSVGVRVVKFPPVNSLSEIPDQIRRMAELLGASARGEAVIQVFNERLASLSLPVRSDAPVAAIYTENGYITGKGSLPDDVLRHAGFRNFTATQGNGYTRSVPLEILIAAHPDLLVSDPAGADVSLARSMLDNPALRSTFEGPHRLVIPAARWLCGLPQTLDALVALVRARQALKAGQ
ncbi:ABC transporter substrate-binding protein [Acetobacter oeni]|uniref:Cobalamin ABC transporter substrate-binding protein n=1 Tax=Acetobacter oeni TaxID=304077 RepID=A0A511XJU3_9PROT|nr:ABC transporter substrate-binding protein [Acetobacter oeni]MBB3883447.1 iron complex transport system substrate-binding protein [Acetobacter oeni]NHO19417.1 ABC transporter substrate-binding protein [Acetobacter oeni]GBR04040.1 ferrichrome ABC transporter substrate-binding protein [Acetobacter oeni LMG 21952]GEN63227.1 cobalamin ABC transporter substrate-binding protein [Acetobacter oeni]